MPDLKSEIITTEMKILRMGVPPVRIEVLSVIDGVNFNDCYNQKIVGTIDGVSVNVINLDDLKKNKRSTGRKKDIADLDYLP